MAGARRADRGEQIGLPERLHEVAEDTRLDGARDELVLPIGGQHHDRNRALLENPARRLDAVEPRHLDIEHGHVRLGLACELDRLEAVARLGAHLEAGLLEQLAKVEPDQCLVFGDQHAHRATARGLTEIVEHRHRALLSCRTNKKAPRSPRLLKAPAPSATASARLTCIHRSRRGGRSQIGT